MLANHPKLKKALKWGVIVGVSWKLLAGASLMVAKKCGMHPPWDKQLPQTESIIKK